MMVLTPLCQLANLPLSEIVQPMIQKDLVMWHFLGTKTGLVSSELILAFVKQPTTLTTPLSSTNGFKQARFIIQAFSSRY